MTVDQVLNDLRNRYGARLVLYSEDLALLLGASEEALASLINCQSLPFSIKMVGNRRCVDIYQIAQWLAHEGVASVAAPTEAPETKFEEALKEPAQVLSDPGPTRVRSKIANQVLMARHKNAGLVAAFVFSQVDPDERLFIAEIIEHMVFAGGLPTSDFVLTLSTSHVSVGQGTVTEMKWMFGKLDEALKKTTERWKGPFAAAANRLVLRRGRRVLFRGVVIGFHRQILVDVVGCAHALDVDQKE